MATTVTAPASADGRARPPIGTLRRRFHGTETRGLSQGYREACDALVRIPMPGAPAGAADSLNVATAAAILLYETLRQRSPNRSTL